MKNIGPHVLPPQYLDTPAFDKGFSTFDASLTDLLRTVTEYFMGCGAAEEVATGRVRMCHRPKGACENDQHGWLIGQVHNAEFYKHDVFEMLKDRQQAISLLEHQPGGRTIGLPTPWTENFKW